MELKLLNAQGQAASNVAAADTVFGRDYNEALIHQVVPPITHQQAPISVFPKSIPSTVQSDLTVVSVLHVRSCPLLFRFSILMCP